MELDKTDTRPECSSRSTSVRVVPSPQSLLLRERPIGTTLVFKASRRICREPGDELTRSSEVQDPLARHQLGRLRPGPRSTRRPHTLDLAGGDQSQECQAIRAARSTGQVLKPLHRNRPHDSVVVQLAAAADRGLLVLAVRADGIRSRRARPRHALAQGLRSEGEPRCAAIQATPAPDPRQHWPVNRRRRRMGGSQAWWGRKARLAKAPSRR